MRRYLLVAIVAAGLVGALGYAFGPWCRGAGVGPAQEVEQGSRSGPGSTPAPVDPRDTELRTAVEVASAERKSTASPAGNPPRPSGPVAEGPTRAVDTRKLSAAREVLKEHVRLYGYAGVLDYDEAKTLVDERKAASEALVAQLVAIGSGGAWAMVAACSDATDTRGKLLLVEALGRIDDDQAVPALATLLDADEMFSIDRAIIGALSQRPGAEVETELGRILVNEEDPRLRLACVQALSGRTDSLGTLAEHIRSDPNREVQLESIHAVGRIGNDAAQEVLAEIARSTMDLRLRQTAIQELARSFGGSGVESLQALLKDPDEAVRSNTVKALGRIRTDESEALLRLAAATDPSADVRQRAQSYLPTVQ